MFLTRKFYVTLSAVIVCLVAGYIASPMFVIGKVLLLLLCFLLFADGWLLYSSHAITAERMMAQRFSNGDDNEVDVRVENNYPFTVYLNVIDEIPFIFQQRNIDFKATVYAKKSKTIKYVLRPTQRGIYSFGKIRVFVSTGIGMMQRRYTLGKEQNIKVYPSYLMLTKYELLAISNNLTELGIKRIRRIGYNTEFDQIKDYVAGNDFRTVNWRATARKHALMVNVYQDERSQQVFNVIDKGRVMQQAFQEMTLLDYAINASLVLSFIAMNKEDKAGIVTFSSRFDSFIPASKRTGHIQTILEALYEEKTNFEESDYSALVANVNLHINKRSLFVLYTNFSGMVSMKRQLPYLMQLNRKHRLLVVFFEDNELQNFIASKATTDEEYYQHIIAEKFAYEQRLIVSTLRQYGIQSLLTTPDKLSIDVINKYIELKTRNMIS